MRFACCCKKACRNHERTHDNMSQYSNFSNLRSFELAPLGAKCMSNWSYDSNKISIICPMITFKLCHDTWYRLKYVCREIADADNNFTRYFYCVLQMKILLKKILKTMKFNWFSRHNMSHVEMQLNGTLVIIGLIQRGTCSNLLNNMTVTLMTGTSGFTVAAGAKATCNYVGPPLHNTDNLTVPCRPIYIYALWFLGLIKWTNSVSW